MPVLVFLLGNELGESRLLVGRKLGMETGACRTSSPAEDATAQKTSKLLPRTFRDSEEQLGGPPTKCVIKYQ